MKLKRNEPCPIHNGARNCCGRANSAPIQKRKYVSVEQGVRQIPDVTIPRGYRELRSKSAMRRLLVQKVKEQHGLCYWCKKEFRDMYDVTTDHIEPKGLGGSRTDEHPSNIAASCLGCNLEKGSRRDFQRSENPCPTIERAS